MQIFFADDPIAQLLPMLFSSGGKGVGDLKGIALLARI